jgi:drug/metabolite transporter (DMT)-like permease
MLLGIVILKKRYSLREYISIVLISIGICICTMASSNHIKPVDPAYKPTQQEVDDDLVNYLRWVIGILMLTFSLLLSAGMGIIQEKLYKEHGKHPGEALYYNVTSCGLVFFSFRAVNRNKKYRRYKNKEKKLLICKQILDQSFQSALRNNKINLIL